MKLSNYFTTVTRDNGDKVVTLKDERPEWLFEAVHEAHGKDMPNDWIYAECKAACEAIDDGSLADEDDVHTHADGQVDTYTKERANWYAAFCLSDTLATAESDLEDADTLDGDTSINHQIGMLQYYACERIARTIFAAWSKQNEDSEVDA